MSMDFSDGNRGASYINRSLPYNFRSSYRSDGLLSMDRSPSGGLYGSHRDKGIAIGKNQKQILHGLSGYAKPGQIMAVMGASGSGKTSLLNIFGQRLGLSPGSRMNGEVRCNNRVLGRNDFGKFGAFVQQDDVLLETLTPTESFRFAAKLRTSLTGE